MSKSDNALALDAAFVNPPQQYEMARREIQRLREVEAWAMDQLPFKEDDRVVIAEPINTRNGWAPYSEVLVVGRIGTAYNFWLKNGVWSCYFKPDDCWSVVTYREIERYANDSVFMLPLRFLRKRIDGDKDLPIPKDLIYRKDSK